MSEIRHFFCWGWSDLDKISQTSAEWHAVCGNMVKIKTRCRIPIWRTFGRFPWYVISEPHATLQGVIIPSAILKIVFHHISFFRIFKCSLGFDERRLSYRLRYTCFLFVEDFNLCKSSAWEVCSWWQSAGSEDSQSQQHLRPVRAAPRIKRINAGEIKTPDLRDVRRQVMTIWILAANSGRSGARTHPSNWNSDIIGRPNGDFSSCLRYRP